MKKLYTVALAVVAFTSLAMAQNSHVGGRADAGNTTSVEQGARHLELRSGTSLTAQLENSLDARRTKVGERVVLRTTEAIKENGKTVVAKGARLVGHVTDVQQKADGAGQSSISLAFDQLQSGSLTTPITATITSVTATRTGASMNDDGFGTDTRAVGSARSSQQSSSGGLLGGAGGAVGGVLNTATDTVGGVTRAAGETVGSTTSNVDRTVGAIRISESSSATAEGGSTLSVSGDNLRLEKGTAMHLRLDQAASAGGNNQ
jgi:hypothetical protein